MQTESTRSSSIYSVDRFGDRHNQCMRSRGIHACITGETSSRGYATDQLTAGMTLLNKGLRAGPGGRSSVGFSANAWMEHQQFSLSIGSMH